MASLSGLGTRKQVRRVPIVPIFSWLMIALALGLLTLELIRFSQQAGRLAADVNVAGVEVGGLTSAEAVSRWEQAYAQPITLWYADSPVLLDPASIGFRTDRESMLAAAGAARTSDSAFWSRFINYLLGQRDAQAVDVPLSATYQPNLLRQFLQEIASRYDRPPGEADFDVSTLTTRPGAPGYVLDIDRALDRVDTALKQADNRQVALPLDQGDAALAGIDTLRDTILSYLGSQNFQFDGQGSVASIFILDLETGAEVSINTDVAFSAASTVKVSILIDYFRNLLFAPSDDEAFLMAQSLLCSNNSSSNLLMQISGNDDQFAGIASVTNTMRIAGARNSYLSAPLFLGGDQQLGSIAAPETNPNPTFNTAADPYNQTTTEDLGTLFSMMYDCANSGSGLATVFPDEEITQNECRQMIELMSANNLGRLLQAGVPAGTRISHKNGWLDDVHGDAGIVFPPNGRDYVIAVFVWEQGDFFSYARAWPLIEGISRATWNYFSPEDPLIAPRADIPDQANDCITFSPPYGEVNLTDIDSWQQPGS